MARLVVGLGGSVRGVATDKMPWREMFPGHCPPRASHVEVIDLGAIIREIENALEHTRKSIGEADKAGFLVETMQERYVERLTRQEQLQQEELEHARRCKQNTMYFVDFSPLAAVTGNPFYNCCLARTFTRREDALKAEVAWLAENYVNQEAQTTPKPTDWAKAINLNVCNNKLPQPARAVPLAGGFAGPTPVDS